MKNNPHYADIKSRVLVMLENSDNLNYAVLNSTNKSACNIYVDHIATKKRIATIRMSSVENLTAVAVIAPDDYTKIANTMYVTPNNGTADAQVDKIMKTVSEGIENMDNGLNFTGTTIIN